MSSRRAISTDRRSDIDRVKFSAVGGVAVAVAVEVPVAVAGRVGVQVEVERMAAGC
jgi:hypothetical protein